MKRVWVSAVAALALAACGQKPTTQVDLVVLAGQSNAVGYRLTRADLPTASAAPFRDVLIWQDGDFAPLTPGTNTGTPRQPGAWGPEVGFAQAWRAAHPGRRLYLVKHARGSTTLAEAPGPDWAPGSGELFAETTAKVEAARASLASRGFSPRVVGVLWVQGEADATSPAWTAAYGRNLAALIKSMRLAWSAPGAVVVLAKIPDWGGHAKAVRAAQAEVDSGDALTVSVDAQGLPMQADGLHLSAQGQLRLGERLAAALLQATE